MTRNPTLTSRLWHVGFMLVVAATLGWPEHGAAQGDMTENQTLVQDYPIAPRVDRSDALHAHNLVERWVSTGTVQEDTHHSPPIWVTGATAVRVTLRWSGLTVGVGETPLPSSSSAADLTPAIRSATAQALRGLADRVSHARVRAATAGLTENAQPIAEASEVNPQIVADLQIALKLQPIELSDDAPVGAVYQRFAPGYHGLRLSGRHDLPDQRDAAWSWPASALAGNFNPQRQVNQLLAKLGLDLSRLPRVGTPDGPVLEHFEVIHVTRPSRGLPVTQLIRGNTPLPPTGLSARSLEGMAERLARFLLHRQRPDGRMAGTYLPSADRYDPETATDKDAALALYALNRHLTWLTAHGDTDARHNALQRAIRTGVSHLTRALPHNQPGHASNKGTGQINAVSAALLLMTLCDAPSLADRKTDRDALAERLLALHNPVDDAPVFLTHGDNTLSRPAQTLILCALAGYYEKTRDPDLAGLIVRGRDRLWDQTTDNQRLNAQPWFALLDTRLHRLNAPDPGTAATRWDAAKKALRNHTDLLRRSIIRPAQRLGPADVVGGITLNARQPHTAPNPTWHTARWLATLSLTLRENDLTADDDRVQWLLDCGLAARFLAQLMFDEPSCYYVRSPSEALGGVRLSLHDNRLTTAATAMTLLAVTEMQLTLDELAAELRSAGDHKDLD